jgi:hypothetical protein
MMSEPKGHQICKYCGQCEGADGAIVIFCPHPMAEKLGGWDFIRYVRKGYPRIASKCGGVSLYASR